MSVVSPCDDRGAGQGDGLTSALNTPDVAPAPGLRASADPRRRATEGPRGVTSSSTGAQAAHEPHAATAASSQPEQVEQQQPEEGDFPHVTLDHGSTATSQRSRLSADDLDEGDLEGTGHTETGGPPRRQNRPASPIPRPARMIGGRRFALAASHRQKEIRERAHIRIASLNMNGRGATNVGYAGSKWPEINALARDKKISVLALQETHLGAAHLATLEVLFPRLLIINSAHENATSTAGVAVVINKDHITNQDRIKSWEIVPGRALAVRLEWKEQELFVLAIYGPNDKTGSEELWIGIRNWLEANADEVPKIDVMLGDFNLVEDEIDRAPVRSAAVDDARHELKTLCDKMKLTDGWRHWNPGCLEWTWRRPHTFEKSRIDRIYLSGEWLEESRDWTTSHELSSSDHYLVSTDLTNKLCPELGRGRWAMPNSVVEDNEFKEHIKPMIVSLDREIRAMVTQPRETSRNIQHAFERFKSEVAAAARQRSKAMGSKAKLELNRLNKERICTQNNASLDQSERNAQVRELEAEIEIQRAKQARKQSDQSKASHWALGDDNTKYFHRLGKEHKPRDTLKSLKKAGAGTPAWETHSPGMANVARQFYEELQTADTAVDKEERNEAIDDALNHVNRHLSEEQKSEMAAGVSRDLIGIALKESKNDSAPGLNGLPYEFWKMLDKEFRNSKDTEDAWPDIVQILTWVYNDIEIFGVDTSTSFTRGWLCPLYKKGNRDEIANYRPITLLNTDYKIYTKALAIKLASVAPDLIHKDQAGFMKGRSITDQCKLAKLMVNWGETKCVNGAIVCLDQEKAYDRIRHDYLLLTLGAYNLPNNFVRTIKSLYEHAETVVIVNGFQSAPFRVLRGVRQGDPLSCLLFNLAIEPLAETIRRSALRGLQIPGAVSRLIISLFADDTCVYLSALDDPALLHRILDRWCLASGAKFNISKTEIVPIGTTQFRSDLIATRRMMDGNAAFEAGAKIAAQGEPVRLLGVYIGNGIDQHGPWESIQSSIKKTLTTWGMKSLTMTGKAVIARSIVAGKTQYLGMVQGMPEKVQSAITETVMDFIWPDGRRKAYISAEQLRAPVDEGGKAFPDFVAAEKSRLITWLEKLCQPRGLRPLWVDVAEDMMKQDIIADTGGGIIPMAARVSPLLQQWHPNSANLCKDLQRILDVAKEIGFQINGPTIPNMIRRQMPFWMHIGRRTSDSDLGPRAPQSDTASVCLQTNHKVIFMGEAIDALSHWDLADHRRASRRECECDECEHVRGNGCSNPRSCYNKLRAVLKEIAPKWIPEEHDRGDPMALRPEERDENSRSVAKLRQPRSGGPIRFAFDNECGPVYEVHDLCRVFTKTLRDDTFISDTTDMRKDEARRQERAPNRMVPLEITVATKATGTNGDNAKGGISITFSDPDMDTVLLRTQSEWAAPECGTLIGIQWALEWLDQNTPLLIRLANRQVLIRLTKDLKKHRDTGWTLCKRYGELYRALTNKMSAWEARILIEDGEESAAVAQAQLEAQIALDAGLLMAPDPGDASPFDVPGLKLAGISQNKAMSTLRRKSKVPARRSTFINVERTKCSVAEVNGRWPSTQDLWNSLRSRDLYKPTREFLWRMMHGTQKIGNFWLNVRNREMLSECPPCESTESMEHILLECDAPGQQTIWAEARAMWARTGVPWPQMSLGSIMGCAMIEIKDENGKKLRGLSRLFRILVSESAFLIWKVRNERRIQKGDDPEKHHGQQELTDRWRANIEKRLRIDANWANTRKFKAKALKDDLLKETWSRVIIKLDARATPGKWWAGPELLVSIWPPRPRGRER